MFEELKDILLDRIITGDSGLSEKWIFSQWEKSVGEDIARKTSPCRLSRDTLFVNTINSVWAANLTALKENLITALNSSIGPFKIKDIRFRVAYPLRKLKKPLYDPPYSKVHEQLEHVTLTEDEEKTIEKTVSELPHGQLRDLLSSIMKQEEKLRKAKELSGWKKCASCGTLIEKDDRCPFCRNQ